MKLLNMSMNVLIGMIIINVFTIDKHKKHIQLKLKFVKNLNLEIKNYGIYVKY